jgi:hypothetical protein
VSGYFSSEVTQRKTPSAMCLRDVEEIRQSSSHLSEHPVSRESDAHIYETFDPPPDHTAIRFIPLFLSPYFSCVFSALINRIENLLG